MAQVLSKQLSAFIKGIGSESRIRILLLFMDGRERMVNEISQGAGLGQSTTSEHLALMKSSGLLISRKEGKEVYYRPDRLQISKMLKTLSDFLTKCCDTG